MDAIGEACALAHQIRNKGSDQDKGSDNNQHQDNGSDQHQDKGSDKELDQDLGRLVVLGWEWQAAAVQPSLAVHSGD